MTADEELTTELLELVEDSPGHTVVLFRSDVRRLIADLRAKNQKVRDLEKQIKEGYMPDGHCQCCDYYGEEL